MRIYFLIKDKVDTMFELIDHFLSQRAESRYDALVGLLGVISDSEFRDNLEAVYEIEELDTDYNSKVDRVEALILTQVDELLRRMGIELDYGQSLEEPQSVLSILELLDAIEYSDDVEALLVIIGSGEGNISVLNNLHHYINVDSNSPITPVILTIEDRFFRNIKEILENRMNSMSREEAYTDRGARLIKVINQSPVDIPYFETLERFAEFDTVEDMISSLDHKEEVDLSNHDVVTWLAIAILVAIHSEYDEAYTQLPKVLDSILELTDDGNKISIQEQKVIAELLGRQYTEESIDE